MKAYKTCALTLWIILLILPHAFAGSMDSTAEKDFQLGTNAFENQEYEQAIHYFQKAKEQGMDTPALYYNLGVAFFKSQKLEQAKKQFQRISQNADLAPIAHYNLGLIALRKEGEQTAARHFRVCFRDTENQKLRNLADRQLAKVEGSKKETRIWSGYCSLATGYEDNVSLDADSEIQTNQEKDLFGELIAHATAQLAGDRDNGLQIKSGGYYLDYLDTNQYDFGNIRLGAEIDRKFAEWETSLGGYASFEYIDRQVFERILGTDCKISRQITPDLTLGAEYQLGLVKAASQYDELSGTRQDFTAEISYIFQGIFTNLGYTLQLNNRNDSDYPTRQSIQFYAERDLLGSWSADASGKYRYSNYQDSSREEQKIWLSARLSRSIARKFSIFGKYDYMENSSNFPQNEYSSNVFSIGVETWF